MDMAVIKGEWRWGEEREGDPPSTSVNFLLICQLQKVIFPFLVTARNTATGRWRENTATVTTASVNMASEPRAMGREAVVEEAKVTFKISPIC